MGAACHGCTELDQRAQAERSTIASSSAAPVLKAPTEAARANLSGHEGQRRSSLQVKDGGFALGNFAATNPGKIEDFIDLEAQLGAGGFGTVQRGKDRRTGVMCAVKSVRKTTAIEAEKQREEIEIMLLLDHPSIVRVHESFEDQLCIYFVLELCEGGELFDRIVSAGHFGEKVAAGCIRQMLLAVNYLHQNGVMHRDLKPENFLLATKEEVSRAALKLVDFGVSKRFHLKKTGHAVQLHSKVGTPNYVAPEVLAGRYDEKGDIWSLGVIAYLMLSGAHPFSGKTVEEVLAAVRAAAVTMDGTAWRTIPSAAKGAVRSFLQKTPAIRPSAAQALQNAWLQEAGAAKRPTAEEERRVGHELGSAVSGLKSFSLMHKLKRAAITVIAAQLSESRTEALRQMFMGMDRNGDGTLSVLELKLGLAQAGVEVPPDLEQHIREVDSDGSGVVDYTEFLAAAMDKKLYHQESVVWRAFKKFDLDGSGSVDKQEIAKVLGNSHVREVMNLEDDDALNQIFEHVDKNHDGMIDFDEFFAMMRCVEEEKRGSTQIGIAKRLSRMSVAGGLQQDAAGEDLVEPAAVRATSRASLRVPLRSSTIF